MTKPQLLAPAGDFDSLKAAIHNGSDAVYLGLSTFNARATAANFNKDTVFEAVRFAHLYGAKVYIALNTLVKNSEIPAILDIAESAILAKADAFIVQDFGVVSVLKRCFPGVCLHASTQMGIHNLYGAQIAEKLGIKRVVLSRETKLADIKEIKQKTNLEIEFFVQGALCAGFSGNCYISALENNNSGNRGRCLQLCRLPYSATQGGKKITEGYLLSPSDLCLIDNLKLLADSGVTAFKIEGRLRRAGYVAQAVDCYRKAIDEGFPAANKEKTERLKKSFFRGDYITRAYLNKGVPDKIINKQYQNHIGVTIGEVGGVRAFKDIYEIVLSTKHKLVTGDGLKFFKDGKQTGSMGVGNVDRLADGRYRVYGKARPSVGAKLNLILDRAAEDAALAKVKALPITISILAQESQPLQLIAHCEGVSVEQNSGYIVQKAANAPTSANEIIAQVSKTGESVFTVAGAEVKAGNVFLPKSIINEARRNLIEKLEKAIIEKAEEEIIASSNKKEIQKVKAEAAMFNKKASGIYQSFDSGAGVLEADKIAVIYPYDFTAAEVQRLSAEALAQGLKPCLRLPALANGADIKIIEEALDQNKQIKEVFINNLYGFQLASKGYKIIAGWGLNIYNNFALETVYGLGAYKAIESAESDNDLVSDGSVYKFSGKGFPLMTLAHCPYKTLYNNTCTNCKYTEGLKYTREKRTYSLVRRKLDGCIFELMAD